MRSGPVQVWVADLRLDPARRGELERHLAADERERAARFHRSIDRERFIAARGLLREVLAARLGIAPAAVGFDPADGGKPRLADRDTDLRFNASRSGERAAFALAVAREVGVDVERVRAELDIEAVARRALSPGELRDWLELPEDRRPAAFFAAWARKEAYAKARGEGLALGLGGIEATPSPERPDRVRVVGPGHEGDPWEACDLDAGPGYAAAVAAEGEGWPLEVRPLDGWRG